MEVELIDTIATDQISELTTDAGEIVLDNLLDDGLIKDIPLIGSAVKIYRAGKSVSEYFFLKKLLRFLYQINSTSLDERQKFVSKISESKSQKKEIGQKLIFLIDRIDNETKVDLLSECFKQFMSRKINRNTFFDLSYAIEKLKSHYINDFYDIVKLKHQNKSRMIMDHLYQCGFFISVSGGIQLGSSIHNGFRISEIGEIFLNDILKVDLAEKRKIHIQYILNEMPDDKKPSDSMRYLEDISINEFKDLLMNLSTNNLFDVSVTTMGVWFEEEELHVYTKENQKVKRYLYE